MTHFAPGFGNIFVQSGIVSYVIVALTVALVVTLVLQHVRRKSANYSSILWGLIAALFFAGLTGTLLGQYMFFKAMVHMEEARLTRLFLKGWAVSIGPMVMATPLCMLGALATPLCMLGALATGILTYRSRGASA